MNKNGIILTLGIIILSSTIIGGIHALKTEQNQENDENVLKPKTHEWARDIAINYLDIQKPTSWKTENITPKGLIGSTSMAYESGDLSVTVSHNLNPTAAFSVTVEKGTNNWTLWVQQDGTVENR